MSGEEGWREVEWREILDERDNAICMNFITTFLDIVALVS